MRAICTIYFLLVFYGLSIAQENTNDLLTQAENTIYSNPQEAIRIAEYVSSKSKNTEKLTQAAYILTRSHYIEGNYDKALKSGLKYAEVKLGSENDTQLKINVLIAKILSDLAMNELAEKYMERAIQISKKSENSNTLSWLQGKIIQYNVSSDFEESYKQSIERLHYTKKKFKRITSGQYPTQIGNVDLEIATIYIREFQLDSVPHYLQIAYNQSKREKSGNYLEMKCLVEYGNYLFLKKDHTAAIDSLKSAQLIAEKFTNILEQITISEAITHNYLALNDFENFNIENEKTQVLKDAETDVENDAVNLAFNFIANNEIEKLTKAKASYLYNTLIFGGGFLLILLLWGGFALRYRIKKKEYQSFIDYFEKELEPETPLALKEKSAKLAVVPKEMEETLLKKLNDFEKTTSFTNQDTSLSRLALQFETNTKYLSEVVNFHKRKNFNSYINELRINYIIDRLKNDPHYLQYKISYLAEDCGFSSHSVFATVFKQVTGISPTSFITILRDKKEVLKANRKKNES